MLNHILLLLLVLAVSRASFNWGFRTAQRYALEAKVRDTRLNVPTGTQPNPPPRYPSGNVHERPLTASYAAPCEEQGTGQCGCSRRCRQW